MHESPALQLPPAPSGIPDVELLAAWVRDQRQADFTELVRRHLGLVQGIARRQLDADQAEDIAQQVFAILARKAASLTDLRSLSAWLHRVTLLQCHSAVRLRMRDRRNREAAMETSRIAEARDPLADALPHLDDAISQLSNSDRELILLRYSEGLTFPEAARRTGRKEAALRQQASRALEKLSAMLLRRGVSVPVATLTTGLGLHLAGTSTATAAALVASEALTCLAGLTGTSLAGITFLTMTTKQSILAGAIAAALLISGPLIWRATQIHQAGQSTAAVSPSSLTGSQAGPSSSDNSVSQVPRPKAPRSAKPLSEVDRTRMMSAIPGIFEQNVKEAMTEWFERDAWVEARRTAGELGLSEAVETELRNFLISERSKLIEAMDLDDAEKVDHAARHREEDARLDAWFAARLTPEQSEGRRRMNEAGNLALIEKLATKAVQRTGANLDLSEEQKSQLFEAAAAKARLSLEEKTYAYSFNMGITFTSNEVPLEERASDFVQTVLDPDQRELWNATLERDQVFGDVLQKRVIGGVLEQLRKVKITPAELYESMDQK
jgi:RNA polymerase sigma factor (sigma-70 family)